MNDIRYQILVTIGTDYHQFNRLLDWLDDWLEINPRYQHECLVQHGQSRPSKFAENLPFISFARLMSLMGHASVVITHGGPATIFESRNNLRMPLCIPRVPELHEIVDDHQVRFSRYLAREDLVLLCEDRATFVAMLESAIADPSVTRIAEASRRNVATMHNLEALMDELTQVGRQTLGRFKLPRFKVSG